MGSIFKTVPPDICLILKSFKLLEYQQWREDVYLIKTDQKLPGAPPSVYDYGNLNDSGDWYGLDCTQNDLLILLIIEKVEPSWTMTLHIFQHRDLARGS